MDEHLSVSALIAMTRECLLQTQHTPLSLKKYETVWRELEHFVSDDSAPTMTRHLGATFLARRFGLILGQPCGVTKTAYELSRFCSIVRPIIPCRCAAEPCARHFVVRGRRLWRRSLRTKIGRAGRPAPWKLTYYIFRGSQSFLTQRVLQTRPC